MTSELNYHQTIEEITKFLIETLKRSNANGFVIGLSGGIDSALSASLAAKAVGKDRVLGVLMPYRTSSAASVTDARALADSIEIETRTVEISPMIDTYYGNITPEIRLRAGNKMARERMSILFDVAFETGRLVLGTGNRTEICLGYTTWYGDSACSVNPIAQLYKTEVRALASELGVPQSIITKAPSADLWAGQTDEQEIGVRYEQIDRLLLRLVDEKVYSITQLESEGFSRKDILRVVQLMNRNSFKRRLPDIADLKRPDIPDSITLLE